ncbi:hypothetical protein CAter282_1064 [Collimonas arenae]|uniref:Uncharacterized protein n=1 Tax=Collimonas arenae TaxID=279058 RepID=A0A127QFM2_9BURK|nr:hypothetical protein CAter10_1152 [Collimonas arenae]AMP08859.1 hypothetical protein CAter282_1064 [Collimonas arenae]
MHPRSKSTDVADLIFCIVLPYGGQLPLPRRFLIAAMFSHVERAQF